MKINEAFVRILTERSSYSSVSLLFFAHASPDTGHAFTSFRLEWQRDGRHSNDQLRNILPARRACAYSFAQLYTPACASSTHLHNARAWHAKMYVLVGRLQNVFIRDAGFRPPLIQEALPQTAVRSVWLVSIVRLAKARPSRQPRNARVRVSVHRQFFVRAAQLTLIEVATRFYPRSVTHVARGTDFRRP